MSWNYDEDVPKEPVAVSPSRPVVPSSSVSEPPQSTADTMSADEINHAREQIAQYTDPDIQSAIAALIASHSNNPAQLVKVVQNLVDEIGKARQNPHSDYPVSPEIAAIVEKIREVERAKPDPLNLLRGEGAGQGHGSDFNLFSAAKAEPAEVASVGPFPLKDMGPNTAAIEAMERGFLPGPGIIPDVRLPGLGRGAGAGVIICAV